jgi:hypothetical protein
MFKCVVVITCSTRSNWAVGGKQKVAATTLSHGPGNIYTNFRVCSGLGRIS